MELETIFKLTQRELKSAIKKELHRLGYQNIISKKGFLYAEGSHPVMLVAHLDTVHRESPNIICYSRDGKYVMSPQGIGGDDRAGVFMILKIIESCQCHVVFCEDEEIGGIGARAFVKSAIKPDVNFLIELDRRGSDDAVFYECQNQDFIDFICDFGFTYDYGSYSDIVTIAPYLGVAAVNISAGYYNAHRQHETIDLAVVDRNIVRVLNIVTAETKKFTYTTQKPRHKLCSRQISFLDTWQPFEPQSQIRRLMPVPDSAELQINGQTFEVNGLYMMDCVGNVYLYIDALDKAILCENTEILSKSGIPHWFNFDDTLSTEIVSLETAQEMLEVG